MGGDNLDVDCGFKYAIRKDCVGRFVGKIDNEKMGGLLFYLLKANQIFVDKPKFFVFLYYLDFGYFEKKWEQNRV